MPDPVSITAAVGWGVTALGWLASPIVPRILNKGFAFLGLNAAEKLKIIDTQVVQLQRVMEVVDESTYRLRLEPLLNDLRSAVYEAEDILDSVEYQRLKKQIQDAKSQGSTPPCKRDWLKKKILPCAMPSSPFKDKDSGLPKVQLEKSLKKIESAISGACKVLEQLNLPGVTNDNGRRAVATNSCCAVTTAAPPIAVFGRDQDRDKIIAMLHEKEDQCQANIVSGICYSVIGIHGVAGSGKSTLAQCVYDHEKKRRQEKMEGHFDIVMWIHVSQKFDLDSIFREMFEGATGKACNNFNNRNTLKEKLEDELRRKQILLVLDDVWYDGRNSGDREELQKLISPLNVGKEGSRILVTSRTEAALVALGSVKERRIPISNLDDEVFLEMFLHYALRDARVSDHDRSTLKMIGEDIAKKLKGSPLAARTVGSRLRETQTIEFWRSQKDRDLMNDTMGALWWSYQYLDEQVRRCFAYCSIFPRGHKLRRDELVKLWVAEGFIKTSKPEEEMEDVAKNYFDELLSSSFLQFRGKEKVYETGHDREVDYFTIHDLLCDLAEEVAGKDCFRIEKNFRGKVPLGVRYLFVGTCNIEVLTEKIYGLQNLRTLIIDGKINVESDKHKAFKSMFAMFTRLTKLRVLNLSVTPNNHTFSFPDSIGDLRHLRYFAFWVYGMVKLTLPGTFTKLYHMQVADFGFCGSLTSSSGEDMMNLINLRHVISKADLQLANIGRLILLQTLPFFRFRRERGYESHQLKDLNKLQGKLLICGLENFESKEEALEVNLAGKEKLTELVLQWDLDQSCSPEVQAEVLEGLCPSKYIERLEIRNYHGRRLPSWMMGKHKGSPKNMKELSFIGWIQLEPAAELGAFIHLRSLHVASCSWDALPGNMEHLTALKQLHIRSCENIRSLPTLPKSLEEFNVLNCGLDTLPSNMEHLKKLAIRSCKNMQSLPTLPNSLEEFTVSDCSRDALRGNMEHLTSLKKFEIWSCKSVSSLLTLPKSLEEFKVACSSFSVLPGNIEHVTSLKKLNIESCEDMRSLTTLPKSLEEFIILYCGLDTLPGNMEHLTALKILKIRNCKNMRLLPTLPKSLERFIIADCGLNALPGNMEQLTSLKTLEIDSCKNMWSLPKLPTSLEEITVNYCSDEFTQSCVTTDDPNWQKIEHIPKKTITFCS
ncbi:putative disease resistance protein RGA3 [Triticum dicoccoides]|uniref:putative disease resistance protein RGA3 n=1 Tax=Triticum dicoccoides TaxID=85692 RepID=UPI000E7A6CCC|nr:putative disease resistance protein RGA3 [Triticum dicoccoides]